MTDRQTPTVGCGKPWCTRNRTSSNRRRQTRHLRGWRSGKRSNTIKVILYPYGMGSNEVTPLIDIRVSDPYGRRPVGGVLSTEDARALAAELLYIADCSDQEAATSAVPAQVLANA